MSIPKIIHYCWFGRNTMPELAKKCMKSWKKVCPDYEIKCWTEDNFDINICPYVKEAYEKKQWAFVSDYARLWIVYQYGGIYLDTDVELVKNIDALLVYDAFFGFENKERVNTGLGFGAQPKAELLRIMLNEYDNIHFVNSAGEQDRTPCPERNTRALLKYSLIQNGKTQILNNNTLILAPDIMSPIDYASGKNKKNAQTISIHHYAASWHTEEQKQGRLWGKYHRKWQTINDKYGGKAAWLYERWMYIRLNGVKWLFRRIVSKFDTFKFKE